VFFVAARLYAVGVYGSCHWNNSLPCSTRCVNARWKECSSLVQFCVHSGGVHFGIVLFNPHDVRARVLPDSECPTTVLGLARDNRSSNRPVQPVRFLGWRQALLQGPDTVRHFQSLIPSRSGKTIQRYSTDASPTERAFTLKLGAYGPGFSLAQLPGILQRASLPAGALPTGIVTGDFNGDGKLDWVVANGGDNTLYVYLGNGDGTSRPPAIIALAGQSPVGIAAGDLNGDGKLDLAVVEADSNTVGVLFGNGDDLPPKFARVIIRRLPE